MHITTVINLVILTGISILLIKYMVSKFDIVLRMGIQIILFLLLILLVRMLFPLKHPFVITIDISKFWPDIHMFFIEPRVALFGTEYSLLNIMSVISLIISVLLGINLYITYLAIRKTVSQYKPVDNIMLKQAMTDLNSNYKKPVEFRIVENETIASPFLFGLCKPYIVMPANLDLSEEEIYYILSHEMTHFYNRDLWIKLVFQSVQVLYWWNPFIYILNKQISRLQELRVDSMVIHKLSSADSINYMKCLLKVYEYTSYLRNKNWVTAFIENKSEIEIRFLHLKNRLLKKDA